MNLSLFLPLTAIATTVALVGVTPVLGQTAPPAVTRSEPAGSPSTPQAYALIHVDAAVGSDTSGDGSQRRPYQTISHALATAAVNSIVLLAAGEYSEASGEQFPIHLKAGVTVQGAPGAGWESTVIRGSGVFPSTTAGLVQATLVGVDGAGLGHVSVTNTSTAGYGLVIETGRPVIRQNSFVGSGYGGVYVAGSSAPVIEGNQFRQNGVVGLALVGHSTAEVRSNRFEQTGLGIRVAPGAQPHILNNTIVQNQEGLLLEGSAQPRLQDNVIAHNRRNGVVEFQTATKEEVAVVDSGAIAVVDSPAIAVVDSPAIAPPAALRQGTLTPASFAVEAVPPRTAAPVESWPPSWSSTSALAPAPAVEVIPPPPAAPDRSPAVTVEPRPDSLPLRREASEGQALAVAVAPEPAVVVEPPAEVVVAEPATPVEVAEEVVTEEVGIEPAIAANSIPLATVSDAAPTPESSARPEPQPASATALTSVHARLRQLRQAAPSPSNVSQSSVPLSPSTPLTPSTPPSAAGQTVAIPIQVIPPPVETLARANPAPGGTGGAQQSELPVVQLTATPTRSLPQLDPVPDTGLSLLQVPGGNIPVGSGGSAIPNLPPSVNAVATGSTSSPSQAAILGLVYKVFVPAADSSTQAQVRAVVPDAFRVNLNGQAMMQVGAYADRELAEARASELSGQGFSAQVEHRP
jgi:parallel beta-helix repeat protein